MNFANLIYLLLFEAVSSTLAHAVFEANTLCYPNRCGKGTCVEILKNYTCVCPSDGIRYEGDCIPANCSPNPCKNNGICEPVMETDPPYKCACQEGFFGDTCESAKDPCSQNPCKNDGNCSFDGENYFCNCTENFRGPTCEKKVNDPCNRNPCKNGGNCSTDGDEYFCTCTQKFKGPTCEKTNNLCVPNPCGKGTCVLYEGKNSYTCICPSDGIDYLENCKIQDHCNPNPCKNNGKCSSDGDKYSCICNGNFRGTNCEEVIERPCSLKPCKNNASCSANGDKYYCTCLENFRGPTCEERDEDPCSFNPCKNGGICKTDGDKYFCTCLEKFKGPMCEESQDPCSLNPCNNASCFRDSESFRCECNATYTGELCNKDLQTEAGDTLDTIIYASGGAGFFLLAVLGILIILHMKRKRRSELNYIQNIDASSTGSDISGANIP